MHPLAVRVDRCLYKHGYLSEHHIYAHVKNTPRQVRTAFTRNLLNSGLAVIVIALSRVATLTAGISLASVA